MKRTFTLLSLFAIVAVFTSCQKEVTKTTTGYYNFTTGSATDLYDPALPLETGPITSKFIIPNTTIYESMLADAKSQNSGDNFQITAIFFDHFEIKPAINNLGNPEGIIEEVYLTVGNDEHIIAEGKYSPNGFNSISLFTYSGNTDENFVSKLNSSQDAGNMGMTANDYLQYQVKLNKNLLIHYYMKVVED